MDESDMSSRYSTHCERVPGMYYHYDYFWRQAVIRYQGGAGEIPGTWDFKYVLQNISISKLHWNIPIQLISMQYFRQETCHNHLALITLNCPDADFTMNYVTFDVY